MPLRQTALRLVGLLVAAVILTAATQLLLLSFEAEPLIGQSTVDRVSRWMRRRPTDGAGIVAGGVLGVVALGLLYAWIRSFGTDRRVVTTRRRAGWTKVDRATLEDAFERMLEKVDRRNDVEVRVNKRGRVDVAIVTLDPSITGPVTELRDAVDDACEARALPCRSGKFSTTTPRRSTGRRRVR